MNILYLSHLSGASYAGPSYSVPKQIEAQSKLDNVFWYNAAISQIEDWKRLSFYHDLSEYPNETISDLPSPFNSPDIIVVEGFYNMTASKLRKELVKGRIPYVIVPRGELTEKAQNRKRLKKFAANILICKRFSRKAKAIHYLTEQEYLDSGDKWNDNHFVIPNGIDIPDTVKTFFSDNEIKCISIGRIEPYQKGLDLLIEACIPIRQDLLDSHCTIKIHGPDSEGKLEELKQLVIDNQLESIISFGDALYGEEKKRALLDSDIFLMTSRFEGHPMALIEALSYGLPAVVTIGSNMAEKVAENNAGWNAGCDKRTIRKTVLKMIKDSSIINSFSENAKSLAAHYKWEKLALIAHSEYETLCKGVE